MTVGCVVVSDRGDLYLPQCLEALAPPMQDWTVPFHVVDDREHKLGLAGAARAAWQIALDEGWDFLLHWEEDFLPNELLPLENMVEMLEIDRVRPDGPQLAQIVLKRQPWSTEEIAAGGIIEKDPDDYRDVFILGLPMVVHRRIFSLNPCLIPRWVLELGWPDSNEAGMTERLCVDPNVLFAYYGKLDDPPLVTHVGTVRGTGWSL
jgi:hypothetical protein